MEAMDCSTSIKAFAARIRMETLDAMAAFGGGHVGGCMSIADTLAVLYGTVLRYDPQNPSWEDRDRLVLSKGHCGPALYATLALSGFFPVQWLNTLNQPGTRLPSHCDRLKTPGIDVSTGSLGQGASLACGLALAGKLRQKDHFIYAILGDGEMQEGQVWEAMQCAVRWQLNHLVFLIDKNKYQLDGSVESIGGPDLLTQRVSAFGLTVREVNGHDTDQIAAALQAIRGAPGDRPSALLLNTRKGGGYLEAERAQLCHYMSISPEQAQAGKQEIERRLRAALPPEGMV